MAKYTQLCFVLELSPEAVAFACAVNAGLTSDVPWRASTLPGVTEVVLELLGGEAARGSGCTFAALEDPSLLFVSHEDDHRADVVLVARILQATLAQFRLLAVAFEFSTTTDDGPEPDAYRGGAAVVTASGVEWMSSKGWVEQVLHQMSEADRLFQPNPGAGS